MRTTWIARATADAPSWMARAAVLGIALGLSVPSAFAAPRTPEFGLMPESRTGESDWETFDTTPRIAGRTGSNARVLLEVAPAAGGEVLHSERAVANGQGGFQFLLPEMPDGAYILTVIASKSGQQTWSDRKVTIDTVAPTEPFQLGFGRKMETPAPASVTTRDILVEFSYRWPSGWPDEGEAYLGLYRDGATRIEPFREIGKFSFSLLLPENETHTYRIVNVDPAGNVGPASEPLTVAQKIDRTSIDRIDVTRLPKSEGITLNSDQPYDYVYVGYEAVGVGDLNGDGYHDVALANPSADDTEGLITVAFGAPRNQLPRTVELTTLDGRNGFRVNSDSQYVNSPLGGGGDIDGDGFDDIAIGNDNSATVWILYGRRSFPAEMPYGADPSGKKSLKVTSPKEDATFPTSVAIVGDMNGDGFDDFAIGDTEAATGAGKTGAAYVVFGGAKADAPNELSIRDLDGRNGFRLDGVDVADATGSHVAPAGDVNGDGLADLLVGARYADPAGRRNAGKVYVVFGRKGGFPASMRLAKLDGSTGYTIPGVLAGDGLGRNDSAWTAGDVNRDGVDDIVLSAAESTNAYVARAAFVVFGEKRKSFPKSLDLKRLNGTNGFRARLSGIPVAGVGDVNGDGFDDVMFSAGSFPQGGYLLLGQKTFPKDVEFDVTKSVATVLIENTGEEGPVATAGDFDGDGRADILIGSPIGSLPSGGGYVLFGQEWK